MRSSNLLFFLLIGQLSLSLLEACHNTRIHIQNGTWLDTKPWLKNPLLANADGIALPPQADRFNVSTTTDNPVVPNHPVIPNREQDCVCGATSLEANEVLAKVKEQGQRQSKNLQARLAQMLRQSGASSTIIQPWLARIKVLRENNNHVINCTGVLINARYILTVAHCFCDKILTDCSSLQYPETPRVLSFMQGRKDGIRGRVEVNVGFKMEADGDIKDDQALVNASARLVFIHERYGQEDGNKYDVAVIELAEFVNLNVVQPICLAPSQKAESGFNDIDCHSATRDNPFPHFLLDQGKERRVCSSGEPGSRITGFHGGSRCESNGIGDAEAGQMCATECTDDYTVINNDAKCEDVLRNEELDDHPKAIVVNNCYITKRLKKFKYGWCRVECDKENKTQCPTGACSLACNEEKGIQSIAMETYVGDDCVVKHSSEKAHLAFCSGHTLTNVTYNDDEFISESSIVKEPFDRNRPCYEVAGSPVWRQHSFTNSYGMASSLAVLTGLVSRHERHCDVLPADQRLVHTRLSSSEEILDWVLNHIRGGVCQDLKHLPSLS